MEGNPLAQESRSDSLPSRHIDAPLVLILCFPLVPHHSTIIEYSIATMLVPLALSPIAVALALMLLLVLGDLRPQHSMRLSLLMAGSALLLIGCNAAYAAWRLGLRSPFPKAIVEPVDVVVQSLFLTAGVLLSQRRPTNEEAQSAQKDAQVTGVLTPFLFGALFPRLLNLFAIASSRSLAGQIGICLLSGALGSHLLTFRRKENSAGGPLSAKASLLLGLLFSSSFDELVLTALCSARLNIDSQNPAAVNTAATWCAVALAGYVLLVLLFGLLLYRLSKRRQVPLDETPNKNSTHIRRLDSLSPRQRQVLLMSSEGRSDVEIAQELGLTPGTVGNHRRRGLERLGISEIGELIVSENDAVGSAELGKHRTATTANSALGVVGAAALCCSTLMRLPSDIAFFLSILIGVMLAASCMATLIWAGRKGAAQHPASPFSSVLGSYFWFTLSAAAALCWAFASLFTALAIGTALIALLYMCILGPRFEVTRARAPQAPQTDKDRVHFAGWTKLPLALASTAAGVILAAHVSQSLGVLPLEASRCHLAVRIFLGVAVVAMLTSPILPRRTAEEDGQAGGTPSQGAFFRAMGLSELEAQVATLSAQGYTRPQICEMLHIAAGTVNGCRAAAYRKLGIHSKEELAALFDESAAQQRR